MRYDDGQSESFYKKIYYEAIDLIVSCIERRFNQPRYQLYSTLESLLIKACQGMNFDLELKCVCDFYGDFNIDTLCTQLQTLQVHFQATHGTVQDLNILSLKDYLCTLSHGQLDLLSQVKSLIQLILVMPATNASTELNRTLLQCFQESKHLSSHKYDRAASQPLNVTSCA